MENKVHKIISGHARILALAGIILSVLVLIIMPELTWLAEAMTAFVLVHIVIIFIFSFSLFTLLPEKIRRTLLKMIPVNREKQRNRVNYGREMTGILFFALAVSILLILYVIWKITGISATGVIADLWIISLCALFSLAGIAFFLAGMWSSRVGKFRMRDKIFESIELKGNEEVLDVGCGRGLLLIAAAKRLTTGTATGTDHWKGTVEYKNTSEMTWENARIEGVSDKIKIIDGDVTSLPFTDNKFDVVTTSLMLHHVKNTDLALKEMVRVLKHGGVLVIADIAAGRFSPSMEHLRLAIVQNRFATRLFFMPVQILIGKKVK